VIDFQAPAMISAARAHVESVRWRLAVSALFALGAALCLDSVQIGLSWFLAMALATGFDALLGRSYLDSLRVRDRNTAGVLFAWGCAFSVLVIVAMTVHVAAVGGGSGRVLAALIATSVFVSAGLFLFWTPGFMMITAAPAGVCLLLLPFLPMQTGPVESYQGALGVLCGVAAFLSYVVRAAVQSATMVNGLNAANARAKARRVEAELKRAEAEEANRVKSEFLGVMTHELRTPLNAVIGYAELIQEEMQAEGRRAVADDAARIGASSRHLLGLIDQILALSSLDAGQEPLAPRDVDMTKLIDDAMLVVRVEAEARGNRLWARIAPEAERARIDGGKFALCVGAIVANAVKFTRDGLVAIRVERVVDQAGDRLQVIVSDTGVGIAPMDLQRIFEPFTQASQGKTRSAGGMGLGLAMAQRTARRLGGDITVTSELGKGSTFTIEAPIRLAASEPAPARAAA
jgi:signal transduction histidine kinase